MFGLAEDDTENMSLIAQALVKKIQLNNIKTARSDSNSTSQQAAESEDSVRVHDGIARLGKAVGTRSEKCGNFAASDFVQPQAAGHAVSGTFNF